MVSFIEKLQKKIFENNVKENESKLKYDVWKYILLNLLPKNNVETMQSMPYADGGTFRIF